MKSHETPSSGTAQGLTKSVFVKRLERLIRLRREYIEDLNPLGLRLLDRSIYATYKDCVEYGAEGDARRIVARHPMPGWDKDLG